MMYQAVLSSPLHNHEANVQLYISCGHSLSVHALPTNTITPPDGIYCIPQWVDFTNMYMCTQKNNVHVHLYVGCDVLYYLDNDYSLHEWLLIE